jgi:fructose-1,6-bisphosphatase
MSAAMKIELEALKAKFDSVTALQNQMKKVAETLTDAVHDDQAEYSARLHGAAVAEVKRQITEAIGAAADAALGKDLRVDL